MKIVLIGINSKYIHSMLSVWTLKANIDAETEVYESNINADYHSTLFDIYSKMPDVACFSVYIFNVEFVKKLIMDIRRLLPNVKIVLGGPEVSFEYDEFFPLADHIICGEGEFALNELINGGFTADKVIHGESCFLKRSNDIYIDEFFSAASNKIVYYESSRGCPFRCSYCISGITKCVCYQAFDRVKRDIDEFVKRGIALVKFVDRTFNANLKHAKCILKYISDLRCETNFHFEVAADLFDEELFDIISKIDSGKVQFEIGIQTFNEDTMQKINRASKLQLVTNNIKRLLALKNCHVHVDLIAGLPNEDYSSFRQSFNRCYELSAHEVQLGFLKMLKGTEIRREADKYGYVYSAAAPYEVYSNKDITCEDLMLLKLVSESLSKFYNVGAFCQTLKFLTSMFETPFDFYLEFGKFLKAMGYLTSNLGHIKKYQAVIEFSKECGFDVLLVTDLLRFDYVSSSCSAKILQPIFKPFSLEIKELNKRGDFFYLDFDYDVLTFEKKYGVIKFDFSDVDKVTGRCKYNV